MCGSRAGAHGRGHCCCPPEGRVRHFLQPWLLLLLVRQPSHGYELMERLSNEEGAPDADPGVIYPMLRQLEADGLVVSTWDTEGRGPARRLYELTPEGVEYLHAWAVNIGKTKERLQRFLAEYGVEFPNERG